MDYKVTLAVAATFVLNASAAGAAGIAEAKTFFARYQTAVRSQNPRDINLFADNVVVTTYHHDKSGKLKGKTLAKQSSKNALLSKIARSQHRQTTYENVTYTQKGQQVLISFIKRTEEKSPDRVELMVGPDKDGQWKVFSQRTMQGD